jgi:rhodanese-related sulfurtransferase
MIRQTWVKKPAVAWLWAGLIALVVVTVVGCSTNQAAPTAVPTPYPAEISVVQASARREAGAFFLDVREPNEWNQAHIAGSTLIPLGDLEKRVNEVPRDKEIVVVCRSGSRSKAGRDILRNAGLTEVTCMTGGLTAWQAAGYPIVSGP